MPWPLHWRRSRPLPGCRLVVYTAIFGSIPDSLRTPRRFRADPSVRYVCFTDRPESFAGVPPWELRPPVWSHAEPRRTARYHKILSHVVFPEADYTLWLDGNIRLTAEPWSVIRRHLAGGVEIAAFRHRHRDCVYQELDACIRLDKDEVQVMRTQVEGYRARGYPAGLGLAETGVLARRHSAAMREFNQAWWSEIERGSFRDQLSFNFALWSRGLGHGILRGRPDRSPDVRYARHR